MDSLAVASLKQYDVYLRKWWNYLDDKNLVFTAPRAVIISFLQSLHDNGASYSALNSARSAISLISDSKDAIGEDAVIKRFMKGAFRRKPQLPKYKISWDPQVVLTYLENIYPHDSVSLETLSKKLATLLALATGQRVQTLSLIKIQNIMERADGFCVPITEMIKTSAPGRTQPLLFLPYFIEKPELCVASLLKFYLDCTKELRKHSDNLFVSFRQPHGSVGSQTLSRWIKDVLKASGLDTSIFSSHSTRHASTSQALLKGVDINYIFAAAGWTKTSTSFAKFYCKPISDRSAFCRGVFGLES